MEGKVDTAGREVGAPTHGYGGRGETASDSRGVPGEFISDTPFWERLRLVLIRIDAGVYWGYQHAWLAYGTFLLSLGCGMDVWMDLD